MASGTQEPPTSNDWFTPPVIRVDLGASLSSLEWTINAYTLAFAVLLLTGAALGDRFGRRRVFALGLGIFTAGSIAAALAPSVEILNAARAVQGVGGALVMPLTLTILSAAVSPERRGVALGVWASHSARRRSGVARTAGRLYGGKSAGRGRSTRRRADSPARGLAQPGQGSRPLAYAS
jgi:MFS family permease